VIVSVIKPSPSTITVPHLKVPVSMTLEACSTKTQHQRPQKHVSKTQMSKLENTENQCTWWRSILVEVLFQVKLVTSGLKPARVMRVLVLARTRVASKPQVAHEPQFCTCCGVPIYCFLHRHKVWQPSSATVNAID
jgi:hypothetical protein